MVDCTLPVLSVATCEYQEFFDNRTQCNGRSMFEGHCPFRKYVEEAPADFEESAGTDAQQANTAICPLGEVKEDCPGYGAVGERACLSCNENAAKQQ
jgi:hypothetical protein